MNPTHAHAGGAFSPPHSSPERSPWYLRWLFSLLQLPFRLAVYAFLRPRTGRIGGLKSPEVQDVYNREAKWYEHKHHLTTRNHDTTWRQDAGWQVANYCRLHTMHPSVLDLCTGTGLTIIEMSRILALEGFAANFVGVDLNETMLAHTPHSLEDGGTARFIHADVTRLLQRFNASSFDIATQIFGIGGVAEVSKTFEQVLAVLKPGGCFILTDIHHPLKHLAGRWFALRSWKSFPSFESACYNETTVPLVLNRLWGWHDPTADFHTLLGTTWQDDAGQCWGFKIIHRQYRAEAWWLGFPLMPVMSVIAEKVAIPTPKEGA